MGNGLPLDGCRSIFKSGEPSRDAYTRAWIKLINTMEKNKNVHFDYKLTEMTQIDDILDERMACPAEGGWDDE